MNSPDAGIGMPSQEVTKTRFESIKHGSEKIKVGADVLRGKISSFFSRDKGANPDVLLQEIAGVPPQEPLSQQALIPEPAAVPPKNNEALPLSDNNSVSQVVETNRNEQKDTQPEIQHAASEDKILETPNTEETQILVTDKSSTEQAAENTATLEVDAQEAAIEAALEEVIKTGHDVQSLQGIMRVLHHAKDPATLIGVGSIAVSLLATRFNTPIPPGVIERAAGAIGGAAAGWTFGKNQEKMMKLRNAAIGALLTTVGMEGLHSAPGELTHKMAKGIGTVDDFFGIASTLFKNKIPGLRRTPSPVLAPEPTG